MFFDFADFSGGGGNIKGYLHDGKFYADSTYSEEIVGEKGLIYEDVSRDKLFKYSDSGFVEILDENSDIIKRSVPHSDSITLLADGWDYNSQEVSVNGITNSSIVFSTPEPNALEAYGDAEIKLVSQDENTLTYTCTTPPENSLNIQIVYFWRPSIWKPSLDANGNEVKYAVQLYGIREDTVSVNGTDATAGLTFGPALGLTPSQTGISHTPSGTSTGGNPMRCIHNDDWVTIAYWSKTDPTVYADCIANGCTHSVRLKLNDTIKGSTLTGFAAEKDGSGVLFNNLADAYRRWNPTSNIDTSNNSNASGSNKYGWSGSKIRATLNGADSSTESSVASGENAADQTILTSSNCLLSCFDPEVRNIIVPKIIVGDKDYSNYNTSEALSTTYDKLWLFSTKEIGFGGAGASDDHIKNYSGHNGAEYTEKLNAWGIGDVDAGSAIANANRIGYMEDGGASRVWLRSPYSSTPGGVCFVVTDGSCGSIGAYNPYAVAPGFCLP